MEWETRAGMTRTSGHEQQKGDWTIDRVAERGGRGMLYWYKVLGI